MPNTLSVLIPEKTFFLQSIDEEIKLSPFKFLYFASVLNIIEKYAKFIAESSNSALDIAQSILSKSGGSYEILDDVIDLIEMASDADDDLLQQLTYDEVIGLLIEVIEQI